MGLKSTFKKLKEFWLANEAKIVLICGLILVATAAFEFGVMQGKRWQQKPLVIEKIALQEASASQVSSDTSGSQTALKETLNEPSKNLAKNGQVCQFVGSKNSNKYHLPTCQWAKRIKPENVVCFKSAQEAAAKNYLPDKNCIK